MLESDVVESLRELARREGVDSSYVSRMANLSRLAPDICWTLRSIRRRCGRSGGGAWIGQARTDQPYRRQLTRQYQTIVDAKRILPRTALAASGR